MECKQSIVFDNHLGFDRCVTIYTSTVYASVGYVKTQIIQFVTYAPRGSRSCTLCVNFNIYALRFGSSNLAPARSLEKLIGGDSLQAGVREADNSMKPSSLEQNTIRRLSNDEQRSA